MAFKDRVEETMDRNFPPFVPIPPTPITQAMISHTIHLSGEKVSLLRTQEVVLEAHRNVINEAKAHIQALEESAQASNTERESLSQEVKKWQAVAFDGSRLVEEKRARLAESDQKLKDLSIKLKELDAAHVVEMNKTCKKLELLRNSHASANDALDQTRAQLGQAKGEIGGLRGKVIGLRDQIHDEQLRGRELREQLARVVQQKEVADGNLYRASLDHHAAISKLYDTKLELEHERSEKLKFEGAYRDLQAVVVGLKKELQDKDKVIRQTEDELAEQSEMYQECTIQIEEKVRERNVQIHKLQARLADEKKELGGVRGELLDARDALEAATRNASTLNIRLGEKDTTIVETEGKLKSAEEDFAVYKEKAEADAQAANNIVELLNTQLDQKDATITEAEAKLVSVKGEFAAYKEKAEIDAQQASDDAKVFNIRLDEKDATIADTEGKLELAKGEFAAYKEKAEMDAQVARDNEVLLNVQLDKKKDQLKSIEEEFAAYREKAERDAQQALDDAKLLREQLRASDNDFSKVSSELVAARNEITTLKVEVSQAETACSNVGAELTKTRGALESTGVQLRAVEAGMAKLSIELAQRDERIAVLTKRDEDSSKAITELKAAVDILTTRISSLESHVEQSKLAIASPVSIPSPPRSPSPTLTSVSTPTLVVSDDDNNNMKSGAIQTQQATTSTRVASSVVPPTPDVTPVRKTQARSLRTLIEKHVTANNKEKYPATPTPAPKTRVPYSPALSGDVLLGVLPKPETAGQSTLSGGSKNVANAGTTSTIPAPSPTSLPIIASSSTTAPSPPTASLSTAVPSPATVPSVPSAQKTRRTRRGRNKKVRKEATPTPTTRK